LHFKNHQLPTCYKFKRVESANMKRITTKKTIQQFEKLVRLNARQNL